MRLVKTRKANNHTSILLEEMSEQAFREAMEVYDSLEGNRIIKPSKKAWESFVKLHTLTLDKVKSGEEYKILGTTFTVIRNLNRSRERSNDWFPIVRYYDRQRGKYVDVGIIQTDNFSVGVYEICFKNYTGKLLYY